jgi:signal peptidase I
LNHLHSEIFPDPPKKEEKTESIRRFFFESLEIIVLSLFFFLAINTISARVRVESVSMEPTLHAGNFVIVNKLAYQIGRPVRGDVIVFKYPPDPTQEPYVKRVIGLPGDLVEITDGRVYINGVPLFEPYLADEISRGGEWRIPANSLFVLGDNRNNSSDSRAWGMVPMDYVIGKALLVYWPPQKWAWLSFSSAAAAGP